MNPCIELITWVKEPMSNDHISLGSKEIRAKKYYSGFLSFVSKRYTCAFFLHTSFVLTEEELKDLPFVFGALRSFKSGIALNIMVLIVRSFLICQYCVALDVHSQYSLFSIFLHPRHKWRLLHLDFIFPYRHHM